MQNVCLRLDRRGLLRAALAASPVLACGRLPLLAAESGEKNSEESFPHERVLERLRGPMAAITIPFTQDFAVDHDSLRRWVERMCAAKMPVLFLTYGDGELDHLEEDEIEAVIRTVTKQAEGRTLVVGGTGPWWTGRMLRFINRLADSGVDAMNVHFSRTVRGENEIYDAFDWLDQRTKLPLLAYDLGWSVDLIRRLAKLPNIIGDKCHEALYKFQDFARATRDDHFAVLGAGQMRQFLFGYQVGSPAYLCPLAPVAPDVSLSFYQALEAGEIEAAREIMFRYEDPLMQVSIPLGYPQTYKTLLHLVGDYATPLVRPPRRSHDAEQVQKLQAHLTEMRLGKATGR